MFSCTRKSSPSILDPELAQLVASARQIAMQGRVAFIQTWSDEEYCDVCKCWKLVAAQLGAGPHLQGCTGCSRPPERMLLVFPPTFPPGAMEFRFSACEVHWPKLLRYICDPMPELPSETLRYLPEDPRPTTLAEFAAVLGPEAVAESVRRNLANWSYQDQPGPPNG